MCECKLHIEKHTKNGGGENRLLGQWNYTSVGMQTAVTRVLFALTLPSLKREYIHAVSHAILNPHSTLTHKKLCTNLKSVDANFTNRKTNPLFMTLSLFLF
jgi:hypothetical protein